MQKNQIIELYDNGLRYDAMFHGDRDIEFFKKQIAKSGDPVLELCCGTGRLLLPLLSEGLNCTGIDYSGQMIEVAKRKISDTGHDADLNVADASAFDLGRKFKTIFIGLNSIGHFYTIDQIKALFECVSQHLDDQGIFIIDVFVPATKFLLEDADERMQFEYIDPDSGQTLELWESYEYNTATQVKTSKWRSVLDGKTVRTEEFPIKLFFPMELDTLVQLAGFEILEKYGNYDCSPFIDGSPKQLVVCRK